MKTARISWAIAILTALITTATAQKIDESGHVRTTEKSDKYGAGGSHTTISDKTNYRLVAEFYYDKCGRKREAGYPGSADGKTPAQDTYYDEDEKVVVKVIHHKVGGDKYYDGNGDALDAAQGKELIAKEEKSCRPCAQKGSDVKAKSRTPLAPQTGTPTDNANPLGKILQGLSISVGGGYTTGHGDHSVGHGDHHVSDHRGADHHVADQKHTGSTSSAKKTVTSGCKCHPCACSPCTCH